MSTAGTAPAGTGAVVLCAGAATRYAAGGGGHKLLALVNGRPMACWAIEHALSAGLDVTLVVAGAVDLSDLVPEGVTVVHNPHWRNGIGTSLWRAVGAARHLGLGALVVGLGDQPLVPPSAWRSVAASRSVIAVATYGGVRRNPVRLAASIWDDLPRTGDEGARALMRRRPDIVEEVVCEGDPVDVDTVADLSFLALPPWSPGNRAP